jgi:Protein of unknown function (DUF2384)
LSPIRTRRILVGEICFGAIRNGIAQIHISGQHSARRALKIVGLVSAWAGGEHQAMAWYRAQPISAFGGRTAESLVKAVQARALRDYLDGLSTGGFA